MFEKAVPGRSFRLNGRPPHYDSAGLNKQEFHDYKRYWLVAYQKYDSAIHKTSKLSAELAAFEKQSKEIIEAEKEKKEAASYYDSRPSLLDLMWHGM